MAAEAPKIRDCFTDWRSSSS